MKMIVFGAGNWGTSLACQLAGNCDVCLWSRSREHAEQMNRDRENRKRLPGIRLPDRVRAGEKFSHALDADDIVVIAVPSKQMRTVAEELAPHLNGQIIVSASKGFEHSTFKTMSEVIHELVPESPLVVLSGPNLAREIAENKPAKTVLASADIAAAAKVARAFKNSCISFEICSDMKGVELCAALKGIIAIGVGLCDGLDLGKNFTGLIMTCGLYEFKAISGFLGISEKTIYGIAGLGDLIATCLSTNSRNYCFGRLLGEGVDRDEALRQVGMVVEGVQMAKTIAELEDLNIPVPLFNIISKIISGDIRNYREKFIQCLSNYSSNQGGM